MFRLRESLGVPLTWATCISTLTLSFITESCLANDYRHNGVKIKTNFETYISAITHIGVTLPQGP